MWLEAALNYKVGGRDCLREQLNLNISSVRPGMGTNSFLALPFQVSAPNTKHHSHHPRMSVKDSPARSRGLGSNGVKWSLFQQAGHQELLAIDPSFHHPSLFSSDDWHPPTDNCLHRTDQPCISGLILSFIYHLRFILTLPGLSWRPMRANWGQCRAMQCCPTLLPKRISVWPQRKAANDRLPDGKR